jgi:hypothetical protein
VRTLSFHVLVALLAATAIVGAALLALAPRGGGLPYTQASFTAADARHAFGAEGVELSVRSRSVVMTTLGNPGDVLEVDAFADRRTVERSGFHDVTVSDGRRVPFARDCSSSVPAERWRGNIRVLVDCARARSAGPGWLLRVERALSRL